MSSSGAERTNSISIGGSVSGAAIVQGDNNQVSVSYTHIQGLPRPDQVDMQAELAALREVLGNLDSPDRLKINNALDEVEQELAKPEPDRDEVGQALERAMRYARKVEEFGSVASRIQGHVKNAVGWLGENWHKLLPAVGLVLG